jgi:hypothetical protein
MGGLRLNLGCGMNHRAGYVNVDRFGTPDLRHDLETFPWPWADDSVEEIVLEHVLEHLGQDPNVYLRIIQEMYRVCRGGATVQIVVPHFRHDFFHGDPTHVRAITPQGLSLFSQRLNREWIERKTANSPLGLYLGVDFELTEASLKPSDTWFRLHPEPEVDLEKLLFEGSIYNNLIEEIQMTLQVVKPPSGGSAP